MFKRVLFAGIGLALIAAPLVTSADTSSNLQLQVQNLLAQIAALQGGSVSGSANVGSGVASSGSGVMTAPSYCPVFNRILRFGSRGDDVSSLQQLLIQQGLLNASATGYFGLMTQVAVQKWQAQSGVVASGSAATTGWGVFGARSRTAMGQWCSNGGGNNGGTTSHPFSADPTSGQAPLQVTFTTSDSIANTGTYSVDFGDGQNGAMTKGSCIGITAIVGGQGGIRCSYNATHTFTANGTYTAKLIYQQAWSCPNGMMCAAMMPAPQTVATVTVTVGATSGTSFSASPTSGTAPLPVSFTETGLGSGNYYLDFGDGGNAVLTVPTIECFRAPCNPGPQSVSHTYTSVGTYTATISQYIACLYSNPRCMIAQPAPIGSVMISVTGTSSSNANDQRVTAPGTVTLMQGAIAEVRNQNYYFTLTGLTSTTATVQPTPVGCWNSFPSDPVPQMRCMIAIMPISPVTLSLGQSYTVSNYSITLTNLTAASATFSLGAGNGTGY